jgi:hypothetical protein
MFEAWQANYKCPEIDFFFEFFQSQKSVLWIRIGFNADTDPAFYFTPITIQIRIWIQGAKPMRIQILVIL